MNGNAWLDWLTERLAVALVSGIAAVLTLALYPVVLLFIWAGAAPGDGSGVAFDLAGHLYAIMFSKAGVAIVIGASVAGFCVGSERMANIFSVFWGTHPCWARLGAHLDGKLAGLREGTEVPPWVLNALLAILVVVALVIVA